MKNKNNNLSFPKFVVGNLPLSKLLLKEEKQPYLMKQAEDPRQRPSGMTSLFNNNGFTLIELLVVVLIIGILAAVAVPQYQKAVEKSKATQAITMLKSVYNAAKAYQLANGSWPVSFDELAIDIPWTGTTNGINLGHHIQGKSNADWSIQLRNSPLITAEQTLGVVITRLSGTYKGAAFYIFATPELAQLDADKLLCVEMITGSAAYKFQKNKGDYCQKIMKATFIDGTSWRYFRMP